MELLILDEDTRQPTKLVQEYDSLIWTERYNTTGDFQLVSGLPSHHMQLLPEGTLLTLRESNQVMIVETHRIDRKKNQPVTLTITGRSFESIMDRRIAIKEVVSGNQEWSVIAKTPSDIAYYIMNYICVMGAVDVLDKFPSDLVQFVTPPDYLTGTGPNRSFSIPKGNLLSAVLQFIQAEFRTDPSTVPITPKVVPHGIRSVRPDPTATAIGIEIYTGQDLRDTLYFDATRQLLDDGSYLFSKVNSANVAYNIGVNAAQTLYNSSSTPSGIDRRVMLVDSTTSNVSAPSILTELGKMALYESKETALFDGSINADISPYLYGLDYNLGDIVKLVGDYGLSQSARVTEYIRSEDSTGNKSYPTLFTIPDWL